MKRGVDDSPDSLDASPGETKRRKVNPTDDADPQTSPASSQAIFSALKSPPAEGTVSSLAASGPSVHEKSVKPQDEKKKKEILDLPVELIDHILSFSPHFDLRDRWLKLRDFAPIARKYLLEDIAIEYNWKNRNLASDIDGVRTRSLCDILEKYPEHIEDIRFLTITDNAAKPDPQVPDEADDLDSDPFTPGIPEGVTMEAAKWNQSPGFFFHDEALANILGKLTNLCDIDFRANGYMLDFQQYNLKYSGALSHVLNLPTLTSINLRGMSRISLSKLDDLLLLTRLSLSFFGLEEPDALAIDTTPADPDADPLLAPQSELEPQACPFILNVSDMRHGLDCFTRFIIDPASNIDFSNLTLLNTDLHSVEDIMVLGHLLVPCASTLEFLRIGTKTLKRPVKSTPHPQNASLSPIMFSNLTSLKTLELRLNLRSPLGSFDELNWFTENIESLPSTNSLQDIEFIIDVTNFPLGQPQDEFSDRDDLEAYTGWEDMDAALVGENMKNLRRFMIIICSPTKGLLQDNGFSLTDEIRLPRLEAKRPFATREEFDITSRAVPRHDSFIELW